MPSWNSRDQTRSGLFPRIRTPKRASKHGKTTRNRISSAKDYFNSGQKSLFTSMRSSRISFATFAEGIVDESVSACHSFW